MLERKVEAAINLFRQADLPAEDAALDSYLVKHAEIFDQASQLEVRAKVALIRKLIAHLETDQIQAILEFGQREVAERHHQSSRSTASANYKTRLLLKKDYSYQDRGLSEPAQYYVYLRRRKPKLDRYIGTLFYIPQGCTLSYFPDAEGRIFFNPPRNVFRLRDAKNPAIVQIVRLICLEPPPPDYTFTKQQNDTPEIYLRLEYIDPTTYQPIAEEVYPFPVCMYEGGQLDRYRWDVSTVQLPSELAETNQQLEVTAEEASSSLNASDNEPPTERQSASLAGKGANHKPLRQVIELPTNVSSTYYLTSKDDADRILERMRLWAAWSEKAIPQSRWEIVQEQEEYKLRNANFKRNILSFSPDRATITLENSLPVLMKWFHDLSLAVSQSQNQRHYSSTQLKLAHSLFVDMSLPQNNPLTVLKKLFGIKFSKTQP
ncbi:MAG: hypothetical protein Kow00121_52860 [Elainellaceae cyanobacterium]